MKNVVFLKLNQKNFYEAYNDDAYVVAYIMKYKLVLFGNDYVKVGFPSELLSEVISYLKRNKVSFFISDDPKLSCDFGKDNQYKRFLNKDISVDRTYNVPPKKYYGSFSIVYESENEIQNFIIDKNIDGQAEVVSKVYNNDINSIVTLNSGIKFKIISKNIEYK